ncbi:putative cytochrome P450 [Aspergillus mulundensis]|uniref:Putative Cytochrome P450 n=1 Tax=Aspergillus mulundensis TaxID=1810919 RepID=A0A3D8T485_9EURO|nr:putative Cytochrome P450 [Aspergillus mulundensis]RDW92808.1 putative Cytochrome P450 [Aspergillus mulundensis]
MPTPIPQPKGLPVLGNLFALDSKNPWGSFNKLAAASPSNRPIFKISILGHDIVFVTSAALLEEICDETRFRKCVTGPIIEIRAAVHDSLFTAYHSENEIWGIAHRIMKPLVSPEAIEGVFNEMRETSDDLIRKWTASPKQRVNVTNDLDRSNHEANMLAFFHQKMAIMNGTEPAVIASCQNATMEAMKRSSRPKFLTWLMGHQKRYDSDIKIMRDYGAEIVRKRREEHPDGGPKDMLHALLHGVDNETGKKLSESQVLDEIINIFIGSATAPNLLSFGLYYLANNPHAIAKAREELDTVVGTGPFEHAHLSQIPYTEGILRETLRLSATAPGFNIEPLPSPGNEPVLLAGGEYQVSRTQPLIALLTAVNRDPAVFEDPEAFKPERMVGEKYDALPSGVKKGFGNGKRQCFGTRYAWEWSLLVLARLIKEVDFELADKGYKVSNEGVNYNGAFSTRPLGFYLLASPRAAV